VTRKTTSATTTEGASANDDSHAVRDTAGRSKNRTTKGSIKAQFREAGQVVTRPVDDEAEASSRRRRGETEGNFVKLAHKLSGRLQVRTIRRQFVKAARKRRRVRTIRLSREEWGGPNAHLQTTLNLFDQPNSSTWHGANSNSAIRNHSPSLQNTISIGM
jgi:hypothetical protein